MYKGLREIKDAVSENSFSLDPSPMDTKACPTPTQHFQAVKIINLISVGPLLENAIHSDHKYTTI